MIQRLSSTPSPLGYFSSRNSYLGGERASGPITYAVDGKLYVVGTGGGVMYALALPDYCLMIGKLSRFSLKAMTSSPPCSPRGKVTGALRDRTELTVAGGGPIALTAV
jgi:hypothetical protein